MTLRDPQYGRKLDAQALFGEERRTASDWAATLGMSASAFRKRVRLYGEDDPRCYEPPLGTGRFTHRGVTLTAKAWGERLRIAPNTFMDRVRLYGEADPRCFERNQHVPRTVVHAPETRRLRLEAMEALAEEFPELRDPANDCEDLISWIVSVFGRLSLTEIGLLLGVHRERVRQIEGVALKRMRLAGGAPLREAYEARATAPLVSCWDQLELHAPGEV